MSSRVHEGEKLRSGKGPQLSLILSGLGLSVWRRLRSRNLTIVVLALVGIMIVLPLTLPQPDQVGPEAYSKWQEANPSLAQISEFLGLDHLFSAWWFLVVATLLYLNTLTCTIQQVGTGLRRFLAPPQFPSLGFLQSTRHSFSMEIDSSPAGAATAVRAALQKNGYSARTLANGRFAAKSAEPEPIIPAGEESPIPSGPGYQDASDSSKGLVAASAGNRLYAEKGKLGLLGSPVLHLGLLLALTAAAWSGLTAFTGFAEVGEGQIFAETKGSYVQQSAGPLFGDRHAGFNVRVDRVEVDAPITLGRAVEVPVRSEVTILEGDTPVTKGTLEVNKSLEYRGVRLFQTRIFGPAVLFSLRYADGNVDQGMVNLTSAGGGRHTSELYLPGTVYRAKVEQNSADNSVKVDVTYRKQSLFSGEMKPGQTLQFSDGVSLTLLDVRRWTNLRVVNDRSQIPLYAGFGLTVLGLAISVLCTRRQIWAFVEDRGGGSRVTCAALGVKSRAMLAEEFDSIRASFQEIVG